MIKKSKYMRLIKQNYKNFIFIIFSTFFLYTIICLIFGILNNYVKKKQKEANPDGNLFRIYYPNYHHMKKEYATKIFEEWYAQKKEYKPFIGYSRQEYKGVTVNINKLGIRKSINHEMNNSTWFFGGSTMWGTGADDSTTIPSYYAKITNSSVLNLGESGFNSFQELIYLQVLLTRGYKPKLVIFYDGINDGFQYCKQDDLPRLRHSYSSRWTTMSKKLNELQDKSSQTSITKLSIKKLKQFYFLNFSEFYLNLQKLKIASSHGYKTDKYFNKFEPKKKYLYCDNQEISNDAAKLTVSAWLNAALLLKSKDIPFRFILQPTASYKPEQYNLNYLANFMKQQIINENSSFKNYYDSLRKELYTRCDELDVCEFFLDFSEVFSDLNDPIFIDAYHISANGNKHISQSIANFIKKN